MLPLFYSKTWFISSCGEEISLIENKFFKPSKRIGFIIFGQQEPKNIFDTPRYIKLNIWEIVFIEQSVRKMLMFFEELGISNISLSKSR